MSSPANIMPAESLAQFAFVPSFNVSGPAQGDVLVKLPYPCRYIRVVSCNTAALANSLFFHFSKLGKSYAGLGVTMTGGEAWIPMGNNTGGTQTKLGFTIKLCVPISQFYLDIGFEAGGVDHNLTFLCSNSVEFISDQAQ